MEPKKWNKPMNTPKQKETYRYREQTSGYQWGEGTGEGKISVRNSEVQTIMHQINKLQGYIIQYTEYSKYFIITLNGLKSVKILNHCVVHLKLI